MAATGVEAYPLYWPEGWKRTTYRVKSQFKTGFGAARNYLFAELKRMGAASVTLSTNVPLRNDGLPRANMGPDGGDVGVAVYFRHKQKPMVFACDKFNVAADNIYAIAKTIEALRGIERWGASDMMERAFAGFKQLAAETSGVNWWTVLGIDAESKVDQVREAYREKAKVAHPDMNGGSREKWDELQAAFKMALMVTEQRGA